MTAAPLPIVMAITGASGAPYAVRLLEQLLVAGQPVQLILSSHGLRLLHRTAHLVAQFAHPSHMRTPCGKAVAGYPYILRSRPCGWR